MINVLHLVIGLDLGGLEMFVLDLLRHHSGYIRPHLACSNYAGTLISQLNGTAYFPLYKHVGTSTLKKILHLRRYCIRHKIDLIHTHNVGPHLIGSVAGFSLGIPVIHTKHGRNDPGSKKEWLFTGVANACTRTIVAVSQNAASLCGIPDASTSAKVKVIQNGVDVERFRPLESKRSSEGPVVIGIVARVAKEKNHFNLLRASRLLADKGLNFRLMVVGDGPLMSEVAAMTDKLGIHDKVSFLGVRNDIPELLREMDVFVLPSFTEGTPLTILEAMACRLPVVATAVGGNTEVVEHGVTGSIVPSDDPQALGEALEVLVCDSKLRERMGAAGRKRCIDFFSMMNTAMIYLNLYRGIVKDGEHA
jgi:glycosyltransferase involved in cell wall biosynthesis